MPEEKFRFKTIKYELKHGGLCITKCPDPEVTTRVGSVSCKECRCCLGYKELSFCRGEVYCSFGCEGDGE